MARRRKYTAEMVEKAIPGSRGIKQEIARRVGCTWGAVDKLVKANDHLQQLIDTEREETIDLCETIMFKQIEALAKRQELDDTGMLLVDTSDVKWLLSQLGKSRGWGKQQDNILHKHIDLTKLTNDQLRRVVNGEELATVLVSDYLKG